jgi:arginine exporter protein ArgO
MSVCLTDKQGRGRGRGAVTDRAGQGRAARAGQGKQFFIFGCSSKNICQFFIFGWSFKNICNMNSSKHLDTMSTLFFAVITKKIAT